jgi:hypothetical protein
MSIEWCGLRGKQHANGRNAAAVFLLDIEFTCGHEHGALLHMYTITLRSATYITKSLVET